MTGYKYKRSVGDLVIPGPEIVMQENYCTAMSQFCGKLLRVVEVNSFGYLMEVVATKQRTGMLWDDEGLALVADYTPKEIVKKEKIVYDKRRLFKYQRGQFSCTIAVDFDQTTTFHSPKYPTGASKELKERCLEDAETAVLKKITDEDVNKSGSV